MTKIEQMRARRARLKAEGRCVDCAEKLPPDRHTARCAGCADKNTRQTKRWQSKNRDRYLTERRHYVASLYWSNHEVYKQRDRDRKLRKKLTGVCLDCPAPCLEDNVRCGLCRDRDNERRRVKANPRAAARVERAEIRAYRPMEDVVDLTRVRILRAARPLDWFTLSDLFDVLGGGDDRTRNTIAKMLGRLTKSGQFQRREAVAGFCTPGARWEHAITPAGVAELEATLASVRSPRRAA